jgi:hypothetical protein
MLKIIDEAGRHCWASKVKHLLYMYGFGFVWISQDVGDKKSFIQTFKQRIIDCYTQTWHNDVSESSRCHYYKYFKTQLNPERYLSLNIPKKEKISLAKFRCSNHKLMIEIGRYTAIPKEERLCTECSTPENSIIDCEYHAFFKCKRFDLIRQRHLHSWYTSGDTLPHFYSLMNSNHDKTIKKLAYYIHVLMIEIHKNAL